MIDSASCTTDPPGKPDECERMELRAFLHSAPGLLKVEELHVNV